MKNQYEPKIAAADGARHRSDAGFSLIELIVVLTIIVILTAIAIPSIYNSKRLFKTEDQALVVMDLMREASQLALFKGRTFRLEIDLDDKRIHIIDTRAAGAADDLEIKSIPLESTGEVRMEAIPTGITKPNPPNYNDAVFVTDSIGHLRGTTTITGHKVWQVSFKSDGSAVAATGTPVSANLYFWSPKFPANATDVTPRSLQEVRAVTIFGGSGAIRYWKHNGTTFKPY